MHFDYRSSSRSVFLWWSQRASTRVTVRATRILPLHNLKIIQKQKKRSKSNLEFNQIENRQRDFETETLRKFYGKHIRKVLGKYLQFHVITYGEFTYRLSGIFWQLGRKWLRQYEAYLQYSMFMLCKTLKCIAWSSFLANEAFFVLDFRVKQILIDLPRVFHTKCTIFELEKDLSKAILWFTRRDNL